ncbi:hypothetical protein LWI28_001481 [Acer negundo]|uniref:Uncharacterized protein n=1 Tax=Acer negundo TaxID=4023 RepID=A0AAD5JNX0_ACENE|nr:hypothetical protein LWI28_001481 [Acer negundo]KAK4857839.1 hypothetical protein QYF36_007006 [Acer negundo]
MADNLEIQDDDFQVYEGDTELKQTIKELGRQIDESLDDFKRLIDISGMKTLRIGIRSRRKEAVMGDFEEIEAYLDKKNEMGLEEKMSELKLAR